MRKNDDVYLAFFGGVVGDLTKSCMALGGKSFYVLVDYGLWQGNKREFIERNREVPFDPAYVDAVVLTHSHVDHLGGIPILRNNGLGCAKDGSRIFCTEPTKEIAPIMLFDTAKITERDFFGKPHKHLSDSRVVRKIRNLSKNGLRRSETINRLNLGWAIEPYSEKDVLESLFLFEDSAREYRQWFKVAKGIKAKFYSSAHVLGGAICVFEIGNNLNGKKTIRVGFSGDLGRSDGILLPPPEIIEEPLDYWITESTYGGIDHPSREEDFETLKELVSECLRKRGKILIPSFSLERAQEVILILSRMMLAKEIPRMTIYLDSPMAKKILSVFSKNWRKRAFINQYKLNFNPFDPNQNVFLKVIDRFEDSKALVRRNGSHIVVAGSGMGDAGRIRDHYKKEIRNDRNLILLVGFMVNGTLNRNIADGHKIVGIDGKDYQVRATVHKFGSFSAHADRTELLEYTKKIVSVNPKIKAIFINHGGERNGYELKLGLTEALSKEFGGDWSKRIIIPQKMDEYVLT